MRSHWGWGYEAEQPSPAERRAAAAGLAAHLGFGSADVEEPVPLAGVSLPPPRIAVPPALAPLCSQETSERVRHAHGRSYLDVVRGLRGRFRHPPDAVAHPRDEAELARVLEWCAGERLAVVPYGGGTSVVGGVDAIPGPGHSGAVSVDLGAGATVRFAEFAAGCAAVHDIVQAGLAPANCRLVEAREAALTFAGDGRSHLLLLSFESAPARERLARALALCDGEIEERAGAGDAWRDAFLRAPYLRDTLVAMGVVCETFESAITWDRLDGFVAEVEAATAVALRETCGDGIVTCRLTHAYPDGAAPYFTVLAPARRGEEEEAWGTVKRAAAEAVLSRGGTITHHHAVGRDHRPYYDRQRPEPFAVALRAAKRALDPAGLLNPGVLVPHSAA